MWVEDLFVHEGMKEVCCKIELTSFIYDLHKLTNLATKNGKRPHKCGKITHNNYIDFQIMKKFRLLQKT